MTRILRWTAVPLSGLAVFYAALLLGMASVGVLESLCPPELMVSGVCTAPWFDPAFDALVLFFSAWVAFAIVVVPALVAPSRRVAVAILAFTIGAAVAVSFAAPDRSLWGPLVAAGLGGCLGLRSAFVWWHERRVSA